MIASTLEGDDLRFFTHFSADTFAGASPAHPADKIFSEVCMKDFISKGV